MTPYLHHNNNYREKYKTRYKKGYCMYVRTIEVIIIAHIIQKKIKYKRGNT